MTRPAAYALGGGVALVLLAAGIGLSRAERAPEVVVPVAVPVMAEASPGDVARVRGDAPPSESLGLAAEPEAASAPPPGEARTVDSLLVKLASDDPFVVLDAADGLAARNATVAIPSLVAMSPARSGEAAPSIIDALGRLAGAASDADRALATGRLRSWIGEEKRRAAPESAGNILTIYESLGHTKDASAARALEAELRDPAVTRAAKTVIVEALVRLHDPASRPVLEEARRDAVAASIDDAFEDEIRGDLVSALERALAAF